MAADSSSVSYQMCIRDRLKGAEKEAVSKQILSILKEKYDMEEEDFLSAELEVVPAGKSRESGLDASMIMAYGQDDRVCAYTSLVAMLEVENTEYTTDVYKRQVLYV